MRVIILQQMKMRLGGFKWTDGHCCESFHRSVTKTVEEYHSEYDFNPAIDFEESKDAVVCSESSISPTIVNEIFDAVDQDTGPYSPLRKSYTWSTKVALHLLHQMLLNTKVIPSISHSKQISMYKYTKLCCHGILATYSEGYRKIKDNVKPSTSKVLHGMFITVVVYSQAKLRTGVSGTLSKLSYLPRMVRSYKRKRPAQPEIPRRVLKNAVKNVISKSMSLKAAAIRFNIPKSTLFDRVVRAKKRSNNNIEDSGNEGAFNRANVEEFFNTYALVQAACNFSPDRIWNTDETGITTVLQAPRVIAETGSKAVGQCGSAERGSLVTMCGIISAVGASIPPLYIFPRVRMKDQFLYGAVPGAVGYAEKSGWM
ncbi:hypothetical protein JTB14_029294 [Gonioctena quinquepunctata]|nr:hypothetical protein JTB14_029294 [Gonioctena quinquepunctata]